MVTNYMDVAKSNFEEKLEMQYKGLDLVRRDWSTITKQVSKEVLDLLMSNKGVDGV